MNKSPPEGFPSIDGSAVAAQWKNEAEKQAPRRDTGNTAENIVDATASLMTGNIDENRRFSSGIEDCSESWAVCLDATFCAYCLAGAQHNLVVNEREGISWPVCAGLCLTDLACLALQEKLCFCSVNVAICTHTYYVRQQLRQRYHLKGAGDRFNVVDLMLVLFCLPCVIAQHQREILHRDEWCGGVFSRRDSLEKPNTVEIL